MKSKRTTMKMIVAVAILAMGSVALADTYWQGATGNWSVGTNWDNGEPGSNNNAYINNGGVAQITSGNNEVCDKLYLGEDSGDSGSVNMTGGSLSADTSLYVGHSGNGALEITNGGAASSVWGSIGIFSNSMGVVTVDGPGSTWTNRDSICVGHLGDGTLKIRNGGAVSSGELSYINSYIGYDSGSTGAVTVDGTGSTWTNSGSFPVGGDGDGSLFVGGSGNGTLEIRNGGLVSVAGALTIDENGGDDSFVNMATGGMLALSDDNWASGDDLGDFLDIISGSDAIRYWNGSGWADITGATEGVDYWLTRPTGDLADYTMLTVGVPEPATMSLLLVGGFAFLRRKKR